MNVLPRPFGVSSALQGNMLKKLDQAASPMLCPKGPWLGIPDPDHYIAGEHTFIHNWHYRSGRVADKFKLTPFSSTARVNLAEPQEVIHASYWPISLSPGNQPPAKNKYHQLRIVLELLALIKYGQVYSPRYKYLSNLTGGVFYRQSCRRSVPSRCRGYFHPIQSG